MPGDKILTSDWHWNPYNLIASELGRSCLLYTSAGHRFYEVLAEIPKVRKDLGEPPLVTPSSQIVGTQAVLNVLMGERYKVMSQETKAILHGD